MKCLYLQNENLFCRLSIDHRKNPTPFVPFVSFYCFNWTFGGKRQVFTYLKRIKIKRSLVQDKLSTCVAELQYILLISFLECFHIIFCGLFHLQKTVNLYFDKCNWLLCTERIAPLKKPTNIRWDIEAHGTVSFD